MPDTHSLLTKCGHCNNISQMKIIGRVADTTFYCDSDQNSEYEAGTIYNILQCPACQKVNIVKYQWHEYMVEENEIEYEFLYPHNDNFPIGLPDHILSIYKAAEKIKSIDVNAYAILLRRLLELVCLDRKATGDTLALMLKDLADKNEIPVKLVKVATGLKDFGNIGAHVGIGELSEDEIPIVKALCVAILEYIYSAPYLATLAEAKLKSIKAKGKPK
jgi:Domain of unknown function (DUF4145)